MCSNPPRQAYGQRPLAGFHGDRFASGSKQTGRRGGFSLVELMVVMVIIGLLASLVVLRTRSYLIASKQNAAKAEIARIVQALETF